MNDMNFISFHIQKYVFRMGQSSSDFTLPILNYSPLSKMDLTLLSLIKRLIFKAKTQEWFYLAMNNSISEIEFYIMFEKGTFEEEQNGK